MNTNQALIIPNNTVMDFWKKMRDLDERFQVYVIIAFIIIIVIIFIGYMIYLSRLENNGVDYMNKLYPIIDGNLQAIKDSDQNCREKLFDYYIKTAYNACSGGSYKNDFVNVNILKSVLKQGVRCLDFEIFSIDDIPVVATSTANNYHVKETFNSVSFSSVMRTIVNYAFSSGTTPNSTDPLLIHLRCRSNNQKMYTKLFKIFNSHARLMLGPKYSFENNGMNIGKEPLLSFKNKIILIIDRSNTSFLENKDLNEYINLTSNSVFMRLHDFYNVKNNPDMEELIDFNKNCMSMATPDKGVNPVNPSGIICRANGCQMVAMRYQYVDNNLMENTLFFDRAGYAFALKPPELRSTEVTINPPVEQDPSNSFEPRNISSDLWNFSV